MLLDRATAWLVERKVLLPGVTTLARLVASLRAEAAERLAFQIVKGVNVGLRDRLHRLLEVTPGLRFSELDGSGHLQRRSRGMELERALRRIGDVGRIGAGALDLSALPGNRVLALARYGRSAKAPALRELAERRRTATLVATIRHLEQAAIDDALDLFAVLMQTKLLARAERKSVKEQLRRLPRFAAASAKLATAIQILLEASVEARDVSLAEVWSEIERVVPRGQVAAALAAVLELAPPPDEELDEAWRAELLKRQQTVRPFLPVLTEAIEFGAVEGGQLVVDAVRRLPELLGRKKVKRQ